MFLCLTAMMSVLTMSAQSIYDFNVKNDAGEEVSLEAYKCKVLLIVNTATRCGFTPQYTELEALYGKYAPEGFEILARELGLSKSAVHFQRADRRNDYDRVGLEPRHPAFDIKEFLGSEIRAEPRFSNGVIAELHCHSCSYNGVTSVRDICKRSSVYKSRCAFQSLHKIGLECVLEERRHRAYRFDFSGGYWFVVICIRNYYF